MRRASTVGFLYKYGIQFYFVLFVVTGLLTLNKIPWLFVDEPWIGGWALEWANNHRIALPAAPLAYADYQETGLLYFLQRITIKFLGWNLFALRLPSFLAFCISLPLWHGFFEKVSSKTVANWFVFLYPFMPLVFFLSRTGRPESLILCSLAGSLYFAANSDISVRVRMGLSGGLAALGFCSYLSGAYILPLAGLIGLYFLRKEKESYLTGGCIYALGALTVLTAYFSLLTSFQTLWSNLNSNIVRNHGLGIEASVIHNAISVLLLTAKTFLLNEYFIIAVLFIYVERSGIVQKENLARLTPVLMPALAVMAFLCIAGRASYIYIVHLYPWILALLLVTICSCLKGRSKTVWTTVLSSAIAINCALYIVVVKRNTDPDFNRKILTLTNCTSKRDTILGNMDYYYYFAGEKPFRGLCDPRHSHTPLDRYILDNDISYFLHDSKFEKFAGDGLAELMASSERTASFETTAEPPYPRGLYAIKSILPLLQKSMTQGNYELTLFKIDHAKLKETMQFSGN